MVEGFGGNWRRPHSSRRRHATTIDAENTRWGADCGLREGRHMKSSHKRVPGGWCHWSALCRIMHWMHMVDQFLAAVSLHQPLNIFVGWARSPFACLWSAQEHYEKTDSSWKILKEHKKSEETHSPVFSIWENVLQQRSPKRKLGVRCPRKVRTVHINK